jgi:hypothetical protein
MGSPPSERRVVPRTSATIVAEVELDGVIVTCAVSRDASSAGLLLMTEKAVEPGTKVLLRLWVGAQDTPVSIGASVVRCEKIPLRRSQVWSYEVGLALDDRPPDFDRILDAMAKHGDDP